MRNAAGFDPKSIGAGIVLSFSRSDGDAACGTQSVPALSSSGHPCPQTLRWVAFPCILPLTTSQGRIPALRGLALSWAHSSFPFSLFLLFFQYKGIFESYLTDSIKLTPNDKPKQSCC